MPSFDRTRVRMQLKEHQERMYPSFMLIERILLGPPVNAIKLKITCNKLDGAFFKQISIAQAYSDYAVWHNNRSELLRKIRVTQSACPSSSLLCAWPAVPCAVRNPPCHWPCCGSGQLLSHPLFGGEEELTGCSFRCCPANKAI